MNISTFFGMLQAPLKNTRWSWGAVRPDGKVILRGWSDQCNDGSILIYDVAGRDHLGAKERVRHLQAGSAFVVICHRDTTKPDNEILGFDKRQLWFVNDYHTDEQGNVYGKLSHRVASGELL